MSDEDHVYRALRRNERRKSINAVLILLGAVAAAAVIILALKVAIGPAY